MFTSPFFGFLTSSNESPMVSVAIGIFRVRVDVLVDEFVVIGIVRVRVDVLVDAFSQLFEPLKEI
jgi:hypothetical protein